MRGRLALAVVAAVVVLAGCAAAGSPAPAPPSPTPRPMIGISLPTKTTARWILDSAGLVGPLTALGYQTDLRIAEDDPGAQLSQVEEMIDEGVSVLVVSPVDGAHLADALRTAAARGTRVLAYDRMVSDSRDVDAFAGFDSYRAGVLQATSIVDGLDLAGTQGTFNVELFAGNPDDPGARVAFEGAMSILRPWLESGRLVVRSGQVDFASIAVPDWDRATAQSRASAILRSFYGTARIDAVLSPYDTISRAIIGSLKSAGYYTADLPGPVVTGQDAEIPSVRSILAGEQTSTILLDTKALAAGAVRIVDDLVTGRPLDLGGRTFDLGDWAVPASLVAPIGIDRTSVQSILIDGGFLDPANLK